MQESYCNLDEGVSFLRKTELNPDKKTLLFIHGLGDSGTNYIDLFKSELADNFNLIIPDLLGCGKSSSIQNYTFKKQVETIIAHIKYLEVQNNIELNNVILVAHSMGAAHGLLLYDSELRDKIKAFVSVEGTVTQYGAFISKHVFSNKDNFVSWFDKFKYVTILSDLASNFVSLKKYYASLEFCDPQAFLENGIELYEISTCLNQDNKNLAGKRFLDIEIPKVYCYGSQSLCKESLGFLLNHRLPVKEFNTSSHFVMQECTEDFVEFLISWADSVI